jgi:hypothetical protein
MLNTYDDRCPLLQDEPVFRLWTSLRCRPVPTLCSHSGHGFLDELIGRRINLRLRLSDVAGRPRLSNASGARWTVMAGWTLGALGTNTILLIIVLSLPVRIGGLIFTGLTGHNRRLIVVIEAGILESRRFRRHMCHRSVVTMTTMTGTTDIIRHRTGLDYPLVRLHRDEQVDHLHVRRAEITSSRLVVHRCGIWAIQGGMVDTGMGLVRARLATMNPRDTICQLQDVRWVLLTPTALGITKNDILINELMMITLGAGTHIHMSKGGPSHLSARKTVRRWRWKRIGIEL